MYCILRDAWFIPTIKMRVSLQPRAIKNLDCLCFGTVACAKMYETCQRPPQPLAANKNHCYDSFRRLTSTKWRNSCSASGQIRVSPQFWTSDEHEMTRRLSPAVARRTRPAPKKKTKRSSLFSAAIFSRHLAVVRAWSAIEHHPAVVRGWWSAIERHLLVAIYDNVLWKNPFATLFSAAIFSHHLAVVRPWSAIEHHLAVVRGWWSAIEHHLLVAIYDNVLWKNPLLRFSQLPCSAIILLWSGVGGHSYWTSSSCGHLWQRSVKEPFRAKTSPWKARQMYFVCTLA